MISPLATCTSGRSCWRSHHSQQQGDTEAHGQEQGGRDRLAGI